MTVLKHGLRFIQLCFNTTQVVTVYIFSVGINLRISATGQMSQQPLHMATTFIVPMMYFMFTLAYIHDINP